MTQEMTLKALTAFYINLSDSNLKQLDDQGGRLAWSQGQGFEVSFGCPSDRALHEQVSTFPSVDIGEAWQEFESSSEETRAWLIDSAASHIDSLDAQLDGRRGV